jgi:hypothetical protein
MKEQHGAGDEHVVGPYRHGQRRDCQGGEDQPGVTEERFAGEDRQDLGDDPEERKGQDVHLGVAEEPEQVLPQDGSAVAGGEDAAAELAVVEDAEGGGGEQREDQQDQDRGDEDVPREDRHPEHGHARCAQADDGGDEVDRTEDGADPADAHAEDPQVRPDLRRVLLARQR